jgi:hypothetical protein
MTRAPSFVSFIAMAVAVVFLELPAGAQTLPFSIRANGQVSTGVFWEDSTGPADAQLDSPLLLNLNANGFVGHPDVMNYAITSNLATAVAGDERGGRGVGGSDGLGLHLSFFRRRFFPFSIRYSNSWANSLQRPGEEFRLPGTKLTSFSYSQQLVLPRIPRLTFAYSHSSFGQSGNGSPFRRPLQRSRRLGFGAQDTNWGWKWSARHSRSRRTEATGAPGETLVVAGPALEETRADLEGNRKLPWQGAVFIKAGERGRSDEFRSSKFSSSFRFADSRFRLKPMQKLSLGMTSNFTSNVFSRQLQNLLGASGPDGGEVDPLLINQRSTGQGLSLGLSATYHLHRDWTALVGVNRNWLFPPVTPERKGSSGAQGWQAQLDFHHDFRHAIVSATVNTSRSSTEVFGDSSTNQANAFSVRISTGGVKRLRFSGGIFAGQGDINIQRSLSGRFDGRSQSRGATLEVSRRLARFLLSANVAYTSGSSLGLEQEENSSDGLQLNLVFNHPRFMVNYRTGRSNNTIFLPASGSPSPDLPLGVTPFLASMNSINTQHASVSFRPLSRLSITSSWAKSSQALGGISQGNFQAYQAAASYVFRQLALNGGYETFSRGLAEQLNPNNPSSARFGRSSLFLRVVRTFNIL